MLNRRSILISATALGALTIGSPAFAESGKPVPVVATFSILGDMVSRIGGDHIALTTLVGPDGDAHVYKPTPADAGAVSEADVLFVNGLEFEGWIDRLVEASEFDGMRVVTTEGVEAIPFEEEDEHNEEEGHHDGDDHDDHGHGDHAFEWAGLFDLQPGTYDWSFAKVDGDYADPAMKMVIMSADDIEAVEEAAEELLESGAAEAKADGETLTPKNTAYSLNFDASKDTTVFSVEITEGGTYGFFTEHMPFEFEADEHFFKDASRADVEPIAQEPEGDHHDHGHGNDDHKEAGHDDHAEGDAHGHHHGAFDPHAWQSLESGEIYVRNIAKALAAADPDNAASYAANADAYISEMQALDAEIRALVEALPEESRTVVTSHDAFGYFAERYKLTFEAPQGLSTESEPSAADVAEMITQIREENISAVFVESITDNRLLQQIANETGAAIGGTLYSDALSGPDGPASTYLDMMRHNATTIAQALNS
ncbi:MAG: zinc ABC transporter substrate-binding protein [Pseudomonadota bacterium]